MAERILIVKLSSMGDVVHALPVPVTLRASFPSARIAWLIESRWLPLVQRHPAVDEVFAIDTFKARQNPRSFPELIESIRKVRAFKPDWAVDLQGAVKSAVLGRLSGAPRRLGFARPVIREPLAGIFYNRRVRPQSIHVVEQMLDLLSGIGPITRVIDFPFPVPDKAREAAQAWLLQNRVGPFVFFSPGGGWASKRWPSNRYAALAEALERDYGLAAVLNLGPADHELDDAFRRARTIRARLFSGDLMNLAAMLLNAELVVGGDTGPLHLAAALGTPTVALYGPTDPGRNGPYSKRAVVLRKTDALGDAAQPGKTHSGSYERSNRFSPAMLAITVEEVAQTCGQLLAARTQR
jgi:lipopolysaccharide heptosyltransferase I